jgi:hypothetical protein
VYRYVVDSGGSLSTEWTLSPRVEAPWLPEVGMAFVVARRPDDVDHGTAGDERSTGRRCGGHAVVDLR